MPGMQGWQAVAFRISGDKAVFSGCGFYGAQDTLCDDAGRHYFKECYIEGSIDFIFGNGRSMYKDCELHSIASRFGSIAAHGRTCPEEKTGFAFVGCRVTGTGPLYVGRAMGQYSRIVYAYTYFDALVAHGGWDDWDHKSNKSKTAFFGVYNCYGPGAAATRGVSWARALDYDSAHPFIAKSFVNGRHWIAPRDA
ncbi:putative pectinesterase 68 [Cardamine amara subsp. amara]|uniref:Pectinesterase n=1 Tax=Cardamine amara subsp. amara TaxID=228776 RepID=A0ABD1B4X0_CARAN